MSNAPVSLATTTPAALPAPQARKTRRAPAPSPQQPDDLRPILREFYLLHPVARECWAAEVSARPVGIRKSVKAKRVAPK